MTLKNGAVIFSLFLLTVFTALFLSEKKSKNCLIFLNSKYFDSVTGGYIVNKAIVVQNDRISEILDSENLHRITQLQEQCIAFDLTGKFLFPGLIDSHTHMMALDAQRVSGWKAGMEKSAARPNMTRLFIGKKNAHSMLLAGFTTIRDLGNSGAFLDSELKTLSLRAPELFPEIVISGPGIAVAPAQIDLRFNSAEYRIIKDSSEIDSILAEYKKKHVDWIKLYADNSNKPLGIDRQLLHALTERAHKMQFKVAVHALYKETIANALESQPESIEHFDEIPLLEFQSHTPRPFVVTTDFSLTTCERIPLSENCSAKLELLRKRIVWLKQNNFHLVFGSDSILDFSSDFKSRGEASLASLINLAQMGLNPVEALTAATATASEMLGLSTGSIQINYIASFVAYGKNPLEDLSNLKNRTLVISRGHVICKNQNECQL